MKIWMLLLAFPLLAVGVALGQEADQPAVDATVADEPAADETVVGATTADETAIRAAVASYVEAFNQGDAEAVAGHFSEKGEHTTPDGKTIIGREAIAKAFAKLFEENKGLKLEVDQPAIRLEGPEVAVEEGVAIVSTDDEAPEMTRYVATHVKEDGAWKLKQVEEVVAAAAPSHHEQLQELGWMVGEWGDDSKTSSLTTVCQWTKNQNFLTRSFQASFGSHVELEGTQVIGWDPVRGAIRSWVFDSDGGFGVGLWTRDGERWTIKQLHVLPDGRKASATNVIERIDDNTFTWQSVGRAVDGEILPNIKAITVKRTGE